MKALAPGSEDKWREMCPEGHRGKTPCFPGTWLHGSEEGGGILSLIMDAYDTFLSLSIDSEETSGPLKGDLSLQCLERGTSSSLLVATGEGKAWPHLRFQGHVFQAGIHLWSWGASATGIPAPHCTEDPGAPPPPGAARQIELFVLPCLSLYASPSPQ